MIKTFKITNFGPIKEEQEFSFIVPNKYLKKLQKENNKNIINISCKGRKPVSLYKMLFLFGSNGSGKTSVLKAFSLFHDVVVNSFSELKPNQFYQRFNPYAFSENKKNSVTTFCIDFVIKDIFYNYEISFGENFISKEVLYHYPNGTKSLIVIREGKGESTVYKWGTLTGIQKQVLETSTRANASLISVGASLNDELFSSIFKTFDKMFSSNINISEEEVFNSVFKKFESDLEYRNNINGFFKKAGFDYINDYKYNDIPIKWDDIPKEFREFISNMSEEKPEELHNISYYTSRAVDGKTYDLNLNKESTGFKKLIKLYYLFDKAFNESKLLLLDEVESALHEELVQYVLNYFIKTSVDSQLICSSHDLKLLDCKQFDIGEVYFIGYNKKLAKTIVSPVKDMKGIRRDNILSTMYRNNKYNSYPDIEID